MTLVENSDRSSNVNWISKDELRVMMASDPLQFSDVDRAGIAFLSKSDSLEYRDSKKTSVSNVLVKVC